jgi:prepilin-type N-terminal cleavage/methylation domain-containing protein
MKTYMEKRNEKGFTLIELLIAIVVVGILAAVAIVGIAGLTNTGAKAACTTSSDGAKASSAAYYANQSPNSWPANFQAMATQSATNSPPVFEVPASSSWTSNMILKGNGWNLTMSGGGATQPTFACS